MNKSTENGQAAILAVAAGSAWTVRYALHGIMRDGRLAEFAELANGASHQAAKTAIAKKYGSRLAYIASAKRAASPNVAGQGRPSGRSL